MIGSIFLSAFFLIAISIAVAMIRLIKGPHPVDRVLCFDLLALACAALMVVHGARVGATLYFDAALILSFIAFLGTIVFARFIEAQRRREGIDS